MKNNFEITSVKVTKLEKPEGNIVGNASIVINNSFLINDIRIINANNRMFCGMPSRRLQDGTFMDECHPINSKTREYMENKILAEYLAN